MVQEQAPKDSTSGQVLLHKNGCSLYVQLPGMVCKLTNHISIHETLLTQRVKLFCQKGDGLLPVLCRPVSADSHHFSIRSGDAYICNPGNRNTVPQAWITVSDDTLLG